MQGDAELRHPGDNKAFLVAHQESVGTRDRPSRSTPPRLSKDEGRGALRITKVCTESISARTRQSSWPDSSPRHFEHCRHSMIKRGLSSASTQMRRLVPHSGQTAVTGAREPPTGPLAPKSASPSRGHLPGCRLWGGKMSSAFFFSTTLSTHIRGEDRPEPAERLLGQTAAGQHEMGVQWESPVPATVRSPFIVVGLILPKHPPQLPLVDDGDDVIGYRSSLIHAPTCPFATQGEALQGETLDIAKNSRILARNAISRHNYLEALRTKIVQRGLGKMPEGGGSQILSTGQCRPGQATRLCHR